MHEANNMNGYWTPLPHENLKANFVEINISKDSVQLVDEYLFQISGSVKKDRNEIILNFENGNFEIHLKQIHPDTLELPNGLRLIQEINIEDYEFDEYQLLGIKTPWVLSETFGHFNVLHVYFEENGLLKVRAGTKILDVEDVSNVVFGHIPKALLFIGKGTKLLDLQKIYKELYFAGCNYVWLATKANGLSDYNIIRERIDFWWNDMEKYAQANNKLIRTPPPPGIRSKKEYLKNGAFELIIDSESDIYQLNSVVDSVNTIVSINSNLSINSYIDLKQRLYQTIDDSRLRTEIY